MTRILVVDDELQIARALALNLRARHYEVAVARDGGEAPPPRTPHRAGRAAVNAHSRPIAARPIAGRPIADR